MNYQSTRGAAIPSLSSHATFSDTVLEGLAPDGGLAVPSKFPHINMADLPESYADIAAYLLNTLAPEINLVEWQSMTRKVYHSKIFVSDIDPLAITPLTALTDRLAILELSNGPTLAFKDIALQLLGELFSRQLALEKRTINILGATSGDTGSSAEYAMRGREGIRVFMLSPKDRMSAFQQAQMFSLPDKNIYNIALTGVFDDCQNIVKTLSEDLAFKQHAKLGAVNSINWARIAAQVVYYFVGYHRAKKQGMKNISFVVPSGNFGNVYAGQVARMMGLPIHRLIVATNENNVLEECIRTGVYRPRSSAAVHATSSPSMDIAKASNFERYVFDLCGRDARRLQSLWQKLTRDGAIDFSKEGLYSLISDHDKHPLTALVAGASHHALRIKTIRETFQRYGRLIDPHTADGLSVGLSCQQSDESLIVMETAQPLKFADTLREALPEESSRHSIFPPIPTASLSLKDLLSRHQRSTTLPAEAGAVQQFIENHLAD